MNASPLDYKHQILASTFWLREAMDIHCSRIALLLRQKGLHPKNLLCAKIFPNTADPVNGVIVTQDMKVYQFGYNLSGVVAGMAQFEEWLDITNDYQNNRWRDEILTALTMMSAGI